MKKVGLVTPPPVAMVLFAVIQKLDFDFSEKVRLVLLRFTLSEKIRSLFQVSAFWKRLVWLS